MGGQTDPALRRPPSPPPPLTEKTNFKKPSLIRVNPFSNQCSFSIPGAFLLFLWGIEVECWLKMD